ncbi:hypothetical protein ACXX84_03780 [Mycoplasma sp. AC157]
MVLAVACFSLNLLVASVTVVSYSFCVLPSADCPLKVPILKDLRNYRKREIKMNIWKLNEVLLERAIGNYRRLVRENKVVAEENWEKKVNSALNEVDYLWPKAANEKMIKIMKEIEKISFYKWLNWNHKQTIKLMMLGGLGCPSLQQKTMELLPALIEAAGTNDIQPIIEMYISVNFGDLYILLETEQGEK